LYCTTKYVIHVGLHNSTNLKPRVDTTSSLPSILKQRVTSHRAKCKHIEKLRGSGFTRPVDTSGATSLDPRTRVMVWLRQTITLHA